MISKYQLKIVKSIYSIYGYHDVGKRQDEVQKNNFSIEILIYLHLRPCDYQDTEK